MHNFDDIRPYRNDEFSTILSRLLNDPAFNNVLKNLYNDEVQLEQIKVGLRMTKSIEVFQDKFVVPLINRILAASSNGLTMNGLEELDKNTRYLFISNHRDIILDSALMNVEMHASGFRSTEIAIGSNLLIFPWINDLVRINRSFIVNRNIPVKEMLVSSRHLSSYIRQLITRGADSVWIAQREGRAKDGNDITQPALLKMLNMSNGNGFFEGFKELKIVPMAISYEIEPCGNEKVAELKKRQVDPNFQKTEKDDLMSMVSGLSNQKGRIHIQFGKQIDEEVLHHIAVEPGMNERLKLLAEQIDKEIYRNYRLFPNNYIAYDLYFKTKKYASQYSDGLKVSFIELTHQRLRLVNEDIVDSMELWLKMYATPVFNYEKFVLGEVTGLEL
ncbi:MAG: 1-acyl-sn-glycerol-3-phosphate acyltransferase [Prolixibacteraceae bacterium]|nr:1-acyl-sn-glycerol-3-phosphate acyltransferase [Prolixibacteraceae bacterium]